VAVFADGKRGVSRYGGATWEASKCRSKSRVVDPSAFPVPVQVPLPLTPLNFPANRAEKLKGTKTRHNYPSQESFPSATSLQISCSTFPDAGHANARQLLPTLCEHISAERKAGVSLPP